MQTTVSSQAKPALIQVPLVLAVFWVVAACIRDLVRLNSIDVPAAIHAVYAISGNFFYPAIFFIAGCCCQHFFVRVKRNPIQFSWQWLGYSFVVWIILQNLVEVVFSGYTDSAAVLSDIYYDFVTKPQNHLWILLALALTLPALYQLARTHWVLQALVLIVSAYCYLHPDNSTFLYPLNLVSNYFYFSVLGLMLGGRLHKISVSPAIAITLVVGYLLIGGVWFTFVDKHPYLVTGSNMLLSHLGIVFVLACATLWPARFRFENSLKLALLFFVMHYIGLAGIRTVLLKTFNYTGVGGHLLLGLLVGFAIPLAVFMLRRYGFVAVLLEAPAMLRLTVPSSDGGRYSLFAKASLAVCTTLMIGYGSVYGLSEAVLAGDASKTRQMSVTAPLVTQSRELHEGERLAYLYGCAGGCHGGGMTGKSYHRVAFEGVYHAPNLRESVRRYSNEDLMTIVKEGSRPEGHPILLGMPVAGFAAVPEQHLLQVFDYIRSLPFESGDTEIATLGPLTRIELILGKFQQSEQLVATADQFFESRAADTSGLGKLWARAACTECHGLNLEGNSEVRSPPLLVAKAYNLAQFKTLLREGVPPDGRDLGLMKQVAKVRFSHFTDEEIEHLLAFLTAL